VRFRETTNGDTSARHLCIVGAKIRIWPVIPWRIILEIMILLIMEKAALSGSDRDSLKRCLDLASRGLILFLSDRDPGVRSATATGLGMMARRPRPGTLAPTQVAALKDESSTVRRRAAQAIYGPSDLMLPRELVAALKDESADVRAAAARAIVDFGPDFDPQIPALIAMMERDEPSVRKACAEALEGAWPGPGLLPTLIELGVTMIHGAAAKSLAALDARSKPDGPGK
jgi:hypothetical protein